MSTALPADEALSGLAHQPFTSRAAEQEAEASVVGEVQRGVAAHEAYVVSQALEAVEDVLGLTGRAQALADDAQVLQARLIRGDIRPVEAYAELRRIETAARPVVDSAVTLPNRAASLVERLDDPLASLSRLQRKFPALRKHYLPGP